MTLAVLLEFWVALPLGGWLEIGSEAEQARP